MTLSSLLGILVVVDEDTGCGPGEGMERMAKKSHAEWRVEVEAARDAAQAEVAKAKVGLEKLRADMDGLRSAHRRHMLAGEKLTAENAKLAAEVAGLKRQREISREINGAVFAHQMAHLDAEIMARAMDAHHSPTPVNVRVACKGDYTPKAATPPESSAATALRHMADAMAFRYEQGEDGENRWAVASCDARRPASPTPQGGA